MKVKRGGGMYRGGFNLGRKKVEVENETVRVKGGDEGGKGEDWRRGNMDKGDMVERGGTRRGRKW